jgi:ferredoxin
MSKITVDADLCTGCGLCASICPEAFEIGDDNIAKVTGASCEGQDINEVASQCPVEAIKVD